MSTTQSGADLARALADLASAEKDHAAAAQHEGAAVAALADACESYENEPSEANAAAWRTAGEARKLAGMRVKGTDRKLASARQHAARARTDHDRGRLAEALARADRKQLFARLADAIEVLALEASTPEIDPCDMSITDDDLARLMSARSPLALRGAVARRAVRRACEAQAAAAQEADRLSLSLDGRPSGARAVPEEHVNALVALEGRALSGEPWNAEWCRSWLSWSFGPYHGTSGQHYAWWSRYAPANMIVPPGWLDTARAMMLDGDPRNFIAPVVVERYNPGSPYAFGRTQVAG